jgi:hypothetical protein
MMKTAKATRSGVASEQKKSFAAVMEFYDKQAAISLEAK